MLKSFNEFKRMNEAKLPAAGKTAQPKAKKEQKHYNIEGVPYRVFKQTKKVLIIENFLKIENLWGENEFFKIDITDNVLTLTLWDNNKYSFEENIDFLITYFNDIGTEMFDRRTLQI